MPGPTREPGEVFLDARGGGRAMRLTWHHEVDLVVLSLWRDHVCAGTFRLAADDVEDFVDALVDGLRGSPGLTVSRPVDASAVDQVHAEFAPPGAPPRQRQPGSAAAHTPDRSAAAQRGDRWGPRPADVADEPEAFTDWAFGGTAAHRATAS